MFIRDAHFGLVKAADCPTRNKGRDEAAREVCDLILGSLLK